MKINRSLQLSATSLLLLGSIAQASEGQSYYGFHPASPMALGKGFSPESPLDEKKICLDFATQSENREVADSTHVSMYFVSNTAGLKASLGMESKVEATALKYSGSASTSFSSEFQLDEEDLNIVVQGETEYSPLALNLAKTHLLPEFQRLLDEGRTGEFEQQCGSRLVTSERLGVSVSLVISIQNVSTQAKLAMGLTAKASGGFGPLSGSAQQTINSMLTRNSDSHHASMKLIIRGGEGVKSTGDLISALLDPGKSLNQISAGIKNLLAGLDYAHAAPLGYFTLPFGFGLNPNHENLISDQKEAALMQIVTQYRQISSDYQVIGDFMRRYENGDLPEALWSLPQALLDEVPAEMNTIRAYVLSLANTHQSCLADGSAELVSCSLPIRPFAPAFQAVQYALHFKPRMETGQPTQ